MSDRQTLLALRDAADVALQEQEGQLAGVSDEAALGSEGNEERKCIKFTESA